jgi:GNAT superfamily N-acetyltransferase
MDSYRYETPVQDELAQELFGFWEEVFGPEDPDIPLSVFLGEEADLNRHTVILERDDDILAGTCGIMVPQDYPKLAGIGEVATRPEYRGQGIANRLCQQALDEFAENGGEAIFLGTENPAAARIYHRLGWRRIASSNVWANITTGESPEEYLVDYFRSISSVNIVAGDASLRVPMIPLLLMPHDWQVLDGNLPTPMISTRYAIQNSCMGLGRKYYYLVKPSASPSISKAEIQGGSQRSVDAEWFAAKTTDHRLVGIATATIAAENVCRVDGFIHTRFDDSYAALIGSAIEWGAQRSAVRFATRISVEDEDKRTHFEELGFRPGAVNGIFSISHRDVPALTMFID